MTQCTALTVRMKDLSVVSNTRTVCIHRTWTQRTADTTRDRMIPNLGVFVCADFTLTVVAAAAVLK